MPTIDDASYHELTAYTLTHGDPAFIHQHVVDAFAAQAADVATKPITLTFALAGLYLHLEQQFTGRQVQRAHMRMAEHKRAWPSWPLPNDRGAMSAADVLAQPPGPDRDRAIDAWCMSVWQAYAGCRPGVIELLANLGIGKR